MARPRSGSAPREGPTRPPGPAFDDLYRSERLALTRLAYLLVRSRPIAEELAQEAFVRLFERFDAVDNPAGFVRTVVVRLCVQSARRADMERRRVSVAGAAQRDAAGDGSHIDETWDALGRLRPERRAVIILRFYEDLDYQRIAELLECSAGTARSRARRGLADLRKGAIISVGGTEYDVVASRAAAPIAVRRDGPAARTVPTESASDGEWHIALLPIDTAEPGAVELLADPWGELHECEQAMAGSGHSAEVEQIRAKGDTVEALLDCVNLLADN